jgi:hypothetical protein
MGQNTPVLYPESIRRFAELRLILDIVLPARNLTLLQASHLTPGDILNLDSRPGDLVRVRIGHAEVADGALEGSDGPLQVRLVRLGKMTEN